eukprot:5165557-Pyramimonas_sp.AAC.1
MYALPIAGSTCGATWRAVRGSRRIGDRCARDRRHMAGGEGEPSDRGPMRAGSVGSAPHGGR